MIPAGRELPDERRLLKIPPNRRETSEQQYQDPLEEKTDRAQAEVDSPTRPEYKTSRESEQQIPNPIQKIPIRRELPKQRYLAQITTDARWKAL